MNINKPILVKTPNLEIERFCIDKDFEISVENLKSTDILTCRDGDIFLKVGGITYNLTENDIAVLPALNYKIGYLRREPCLLRCRLTGFRYSGCEEGKLPYIEKEAVASKDNIAQIDGVLRLIETEYTNKLSDWKASAVHLSDYLIILLERFASTLEGVSVRPDNLADAVKNYISANYEKNITLSVLADVFFVSPFHISHLFKETYGISPIQYLINVRMNAAKDMLANTSYSIQEIAAKAGYPNANYFNILFKRFSGLSPGAYRRQCR